MVKNIVNIVIVVGLVAGFPGVLQAASSDFNIVSAANVQYIKDTKATRKWRKQADHLYAQHPRHYQQATSGVSVSTLVLNSFQSEYLIGQDVYAAGLQGLLLTVKNDTQDIIFVGSDSLSMPIVSQGMLYAQLLGGISPLKAGFITWSLGLGLWVGVLALDACLHIILPVFFLLGICVYELYASNESNVRHAIHNHILKSDEQYALYPGQRLDKIICVDKDTNLDSFTLSLHGMNSDIAPFVVVP